MKTTTKAALILTFLGFTLTNGVLYSSDPPVGNTGGPGETTCQQAGCHNGGSYAGSVTISGVPDEVVANTTYTITLTNTSNAVRAGFQLVCLNAANAQCGDLIAGTGTSIELSGTKQYIRHSPGKSLSGGKVSWTFSWKAPATLTNSNKTITFYFASLAANGNASESGDNVLKDNKAVLFKTGVGNKEVADAIAVKFFPNPTKDFLTVELADYSNASLSLTNITGQVLLQKNLTEKVSKIDISYLTAGLYNAQIQAGNKSVSKKIVIH